MLCSVLCISVISQVIKHSGKDTCFHIGENSHEGLPALLAPAFSVGYG